MKNPFAKAQKAVTRVTADDGSIWELDDDGWDARLIKPARAPRCPHCKAQISAREDLRHDHVAACAVWG